LRANALLGNADYLESDVQVILKYQPAHVAANAILGSRRLSQKRYAESEKFLLQSVKSQPTAGALNDLATLLSLTGNYREAEKQARLAIRLKPNFYQAWDTLGNILLESGRTSDASEALRCALQWGRGDPRLYLTLTRIHFKQGHFQEAGKTLGYSKPLLGHMSGSVREEYDKLRNQLTPGLGFKQQVN